MLKRVLQEDSQEQGAEGMQGGVVQRGWVTGQVRGNVQGTLVLG